MSAGGTERAGRLSALAGSIPTLGPISLLDKDFQIPRRADVGRDSHPVLTLAEPRGDLQHEVLVVLLESDRRGYLEFAPRRRLQLEREVAVVSGADRGRHANRYLLARHDTDRRRWRSDLYL